MNWARLHKREMGGEGVQYFFVEFSPLVYIGAVFKAVASIIRLCFKPQKAFERSLSSKFEYSPKACKFVRMGKFSKDRYGGVLILFHQLGPTGPSWS